MSALNNVLLSLGSAAKILTAQIIPGAGNLGNLVKAGEALGAAFKTIKDANGGTAPADAEASHDALFEKVKAHADGTLSRLEGGGG